MTWLSTSGTSLLLLLVVACGGPSAPPAAAPAGASGGAAAQPSGESRPAAAASPAALAPVRVAIPDLSISSLPLLIGIEKGHFREAGLAVELVQIGGQAALPALLADEVGYMYGWGATSAGLVQGAPLKVLAIFQDRPPHVLVARPEIRTPADLRGRRVSTSRPGGTDDQIIQKVLQAAGLRGDDIEMVRLGETSLRFTALLAGQIDATALAEPYTSQGRKEGFHTLVRGGDVYQVPISLVATTHAHLAAAPEEVRRYLRGVVGVLGYLNDPANVAETVRVATAHFALDPALADDMVAEALSTTVANGEIPDDVLDAALAVARAQVDNPAPIAREDLFDFSLLRAVRREAGLP